MLHGLWYSVSILAILGCHELGHYYACRYYGVDASLPYFLPVPFLLTGTLGAFIRIRAADSRQARALRHRHRRPDRRLPRRGAGAAHRHVPVDGGPGARRTFSGEVFELGEPLLFKAPRG